MQRNEEIKENLEQKKFVSPRFFSNNISRVVFCALFVVLTEILVSYYVSQLVISEVHNKWRVEDFKEEVRKILEDYAASTSSNVKTSNREKRHTFFRGHMGHNPGTMYGNVLENYCLKFNNHCSRMVQGRRGPQGPSGFQGAPGNAGRPGPSGPKGQQGQPGSPGQPGAGGKPGPPGVSGPPGPKGERGNNGYNGKDGMPGIPGSIGQKGEPGVPGYPGYPGSNGIKGETGNPGLGGIPGVIGFPGLKGDRGEAGNPGLKGDKGNNGLPGIYGPPGIPGQKGESGTPGLDGLPDLPGLKGDKGDRGKPGVDGVPGLPGLPGSKGDKGDSGPIDVPGGEGQKGDSGPVGPSVIIHRKVVNRWNKDETDEKIKECTISEIGTPETQVYTNFTFSSWMQDLGRTPIEDEQEKFWVTRENQWSKLFEFDSETTFRSGMLSKTYRLKRRFGGSRHVIYKNCFFYNERDSNTIVKLSLDDEREKTLDLNIADSEDGNSMNFNVDENALWVIIPSSAPNKLNVFKIDDEAMKVKQTWDINMGILEYEEIFIVCGVLYVTHSDASNKITVIYALDLYTDEKLDVDLELTSPFKNTTMLRYNPVAVALYASSADGNQITYPLQFD